MLASSIQAGGGAPGFISGLVAQRQQRAVYQTVALALYQPLPVQRKADGRGVVEQGQRLGAGGQLQPGLAPGVAGRHHQLFAVQDGRVEGAVVAAKAGWRGRVV